MAEYSAMRESGISWIGTVPSHWHVRTLYQLVSQVKKKNSELKEQNLLSLSYGKIKRKDINATDGLLPNSFDSYNIIDAGDIVLRLTDLQNDHTSMRVGLATERGIITSAYITLRPTSAEMSRYLYYLLHTFDIRKGFYGMGSGVRQGLNYDEVKALRIIVPETEEEQSAIATYLDDQCTLIDAAISEAKSSAEEYKLWKASIIYESVTKGLDTNAVTKDSGIKWIGCIPNHWNVTTIGRYLDSIQTGPFGSQLHADEYIEGGIPVINPANIREGQIVVDNKCTIKERKARELCQHLLAKGDIVFGRRGEMGRCACVHTSDKLFCGTGCIRIRCSSDLLPEYAAYYLQMPLVCRYLELNSVGTTMMNLNTSIISDIPFPCPSVSEQRDIVRLLRNSCNTIEKLIADKQSLIADLESYKKSLIYEVVTGKRKVA